MTNNYTLNFHSIHLWYIYFHDNIVIYSKCLNCLSQKEQKQAFAFKFSKHKKRYIFYHVVVRHILSKYLKKNPGDLIFQYTNYNKPYLLDNDLDIQFNLSHSHNIAVLAITKKHPIGVDIEYIKPIDDINDIAEQHFSKNEFSKFIVLPIQEKITSFYNIWTRKEAFIKAIGEGLSYPLNKFDVTCLPNEPIKILQINDSINQVDKWYLNSWDYLNTTNKNNEKYIISLATSDKKTNNNITKFIWSN